MKQISFSLRSGQKQTSPKHSSYGLYSYEFKFQINGTSINPEATKLKINVRNGVRQLYYQSAWHSKSKNSKERDILT